MCISRRFGYKRPRESCPPAHNQNPQPRLAIHSCIANHLVSPRCASRSPPLSSLPARPWLCPPVSLSQSTTLVSHFANSVRLRAQPAISHHAGRQRCTPATRWRRCDRRPRHTRHPPRRCSPQGLPAPRPTSPSSMHQTNPPSCSSRMRSARPLPRSSSASPRAVPGPAPSRP